MLASLDVTRTTAMKPTPCTLVALALIGGAGGAATGAEPAAAGASSIDRRPAMTASKPAQRSGRADADELATLFPGTLGPWKLTELQKNPMVPQSPAPQPRVRAVYTQEPHSAELFVRTGPPGGVAKGQREVYRESPPQRDGTLVVVTLSNGVAIGATSRTADAAALEALIHTIDLGQVEKLKPVKR
jgi:hypothetical protein